MEKVYKYKKIDDFETFSEFLTEKIFKTKKLRGTRSKRLICAKKCLENAKNYWRKKSLLDECETVSKEEEWEMSKEKNSRIMQTSPKKEWRFRPF